MVERASFVYAIVFLLICSVLHICVNTKFACCKGVIQYGQKIKK